MPQEEGGPGERDVQAAARSRSRARKKKQYPLPEDPEELDQLRRFVQSLPAEYRDEFLLDNAWVEEARIGVREKRRNVDLLMERKATLEQTLRKPEQSRRLARLEEKLQAAWAALAEQSSEALMRMHTINQKWK